jgi:hypothetical protein
LVAIVIKNKTSSETANQEKFLREYKSTLFALQKPPK